MFIAKLSSSWQLKPQLNWDSIITTCLPTPHPNLTGIVLISGAAGLKLCIYAYPRRICLFFSDVQTYGGVHPPPWHDNQKFFTKQSFCWKRIFAKKKFAEKNMQKNLVQTNLVQKNVVQKNLVQKKCFAEEKKIAK